MNQLEKFYHFLDRYALKALILWVIVLSILYSSLSLVRHAHFQSGGFDLGLYDQSVWQYSRFLWPYNTIKDRFILGDHLTLTLPLLSPLFWLWDDVRILLVFQAIAIASSSIAIFFLAKLRTFPSYVAFVVAWTYSLFYGIQYGVFFDFHPVLYGVALLAWFVYFFEAKKKIFWIVFLVLALLTQENMGLALSSLGCIYFFRKEFRVYGIWFFIGGVGVSLAASKAVSLFSPIGFQYWPHISFNPLSIAFSFFDSEEKRQVWLYTLSSFSFLSLFSLGAMAAIIFDLAQYFATGPEFSRMWSPLMHHRAVLALFVTLGALDALALLRKKKISMMWIALLIVAMTLFEQFLFHYPLNKLTKNDYWKEEDWMINTQKLIDEVPVGSGVATQQNLIPQLSHREQIYLVWPREHDFDSQTSSGQGTPCGQKSCWWLDFDKKAEYLVVDTRPDQWLTQILESNDHWNEAMRNMQVLKKIQLEKSIGDARIYRIVK
ncbi:DUF2079 domain-containing protein [Candidatus Gottesmanbacteria bacterium]|nr:DUF2079 domain-containing protein [Candidatus Gottesmanbacteria bacterium]